MAHRQTAKEDGEDGGKSNRLCKDVREEAKQRNKGHLVVRAEERLAIGKRGEALLKDALEDDRTRKAYADAECKACRKQEEEPRAGLLPQLT